MAAAQLANVQLSRTLKQIVQMDDYDIVRFGEAGKTCLATKDLNSCHAVVIVSKKAAIIAHIAPNIPPDAPAAVRSQFPTAQHWIQAMMAKVIKCVEANKSFFDIPGSGGIVIYGLYEGKIALPDQVKLLAANIVKLLHMPARAYAYEVPGTPGPNKGIVLVEGHAAGLPPTLWVEANKIELLAGSGSAGPSETASTAGLSK